MGVPLAFFHHRSHLLPRDRAAAARAPHEDAAVRTRPAAVEPVAAPADAGGPAAASERIFLQVNLPPR